MKNGLKLYLEQLVGENPNKMDLARRSDDLPYHVIVDIFRGKIQRPDPEILEALVIGLRSLDHEVTYDDLALAAYGRLVRCNPYDPAAQDAALAHAG